nr:hypothetical protein [Eubacterium sp.]
MEKRIFALFLAISMVLQNIPYKPISGIGASVNAERITGAEEITDETGSEDATENEDAASEEPETAEQATEDSETTESITEEVTSKEEASESITSEDMTTEEITSEEISSEEISFEESTVNKEIGSSEITTEEVTEATTEKIEKQPTFISSVEGVDVSDIDFSSKELLVGTDDPAVFTWDTEVVSEYNGIYLTRFQNEEETKNAYTYYYGKADFVDANVEFSVQDNEETEGADLTNLNDGDDAISNLNDMDPETVPARTIAVIDTGINASDLVGSVSVLGGDA